MMYIIKIDVAFRVVSIVFFNTFTSVQGKDNALLLGGCGSFSGFESGETRLCFVDLVKLGALFVFWAKRVFFGSMFNLLNIN